MTELETFGEVAYVHDGSLEGLLSCIFQAYARHENPTDIVPEGCLQPRLDQRIAIIETDAAQAARVFAGIEKTCGRGAAAALGRAALCDEPATGRIALSFVRYAMGEGRRYCTGCSRKHCSGTCSKGIMTDLARPEVQALYRLAHRVCNEAERMRQFLRFEELEGGLWLARCAPKDNVTPLNMNHFSARFNDEPFIIFDERHGIAGVHNPALREIAAPADAACHKYAEERNPFSWYLVKTAQLNIPKATESEALMKRAWQTFYKSISIEARYNPELRQHFMPQRLWPHLTELTGEQ